jgi:hypothetical protein
VKYFNSRTGASVVHHVKCRGWHVELNAEWMEICITGWEVGKSEALNSCFIGNIEIRIVINIESATRDPFVVEISLQKV